MLFLPQLNSINFYRTESGYTKKNVTLIAYDGRELDGFVYINPKKPGEEHYPSDRYLGVLVKGIDPLGQPTVLANRITVFAQCRPFVPTFQNLGKQIKLARLWVWLSGSLMTHVLYPFNLLKGKKSIKALLQFGTVEEIWTQIVQRKKHFGRILA